MGYRLIRKDKTATSLGCLSKAWYSDGKNEYLVKGNIEFNKGGYGYEPFSEYIASIIAKHLNIPHIEYKVVRNVFKDVKTYGIDYVSVCKKFSTPKGYQRLTALQFMELMHGNSINTNYWTLFNRYNRDTGGFLKMLIFDAIIGNEDRHLNNWDMLVSNNDIRVAPIFDNGASLLAYVQDKDLSLDFKIGRDRAKPFSNTHTKQIALIKKYYKDFKIPFKEYELKIISNNILDEISDITNLLGYRGKCINKYIKNRMEHYGSMFCT